jgi:probable HAF family extracellular repeat protein
MKKRNGTTGYVSFGLAVCASLSVHVSRASAQPADAVAAADRQPVIVLGTLGGDSSTTTAINSRRQIVGHSNLSAGGQDAPFLWENGVMRPLPTLGGRGGNARDINERGQIVGISSDANGVPTPTLWQDGQATALEFLPGSFLCVPEAINDLGLIVGFCAVPVGLNNYGVPVFWKDGVVEPLAMPPTVQQAFPVDLNDAGAVVGYAFSTTGDVFFFLWDDGVLRDLQAVTGRRFESVGGINDAGQISGWGISRTLSVEALLWDGRKTIGLRPLPPTTGSVAGDLNSHGQVIGHSGIQGVVWTHGKVVVLPAPLGDVVDPVAISDTGDVAGNATVRGGRPDGPSLAVLWPGAAKVPPPTKP